MEGWLSTGVGEGETGEAGRVMGWGLWTPASSSPRRKRGKGRGGGGKGDRKREAKREREREREDERRERLVQTCTNFLY